jgi:hypothetical protein
MESCSGVTMAVQSYQIVNGARVLIFTCDEPGCGKPACFGEGVKLRAALATGDAKLGGKWFCADHRPRAAGKDEEC